MREGFMTAAKNQFETDIRKKRRIRSAVITVFAVICAGALFTLLGFAHQHQKDTVCRKVEITVDAIDGLKFINEQRVLEFAQSATGGLEGKMVDSIDVAAIHQRLMDCSIVSHADVVTTVDGRCQIHVKQHKPVARIWNPDGSSFYLDSAGYTMEISDLAIVRLPVYLVQLNEPMIRGSVADPEMDPQVLAKSTLDEIYRFNEFIRHDSFWRAQIDHVVVNAAGDFEMIPRVGNHVIRIGPAEELDLKFRKLMAFYQATVNHRDLNQYAVISAQYDGQIVCQKKATPQPINTESSSNPAKP